MKQLKKRLIYESKLLKKFPNLVFGFTTKKMGDMREIRNLKELAKRLNFSFKNLCLMRQVHGNKIVLVNNGGMNKDVDGMVAKNQGLLLVTRVADCLPILFLCAKATKRTCPKGYFAAKRKSSSFYEPVKKIIGVCHAGRMGTELKVSEKMVEKILILGGEVKDLIVVIGPHIHKCCYPVDLTKKNLKQLINSGVKKENLEIISECTCCGHNYFSYRRDGKNFSEFAGFIGIKHD